MSPLGPLQRARSSLRLAAIAAFLAACGRVPDLPDEDLLDAGADQADPGGDVETPPQVPDAAPPPDRVILTVSERTHDFGSSRTGQESLPLVVTVLNEGIDATDRLSVRMTGDTRDFDVVDDDPCTKVVLAAGAQCDVMLRFKPTGQGRRTASVVFSHGEQSVTMTLAGSGLPLGLLMIEPPHMRFPEQLIGGAVEAAFTITNTGAAELPAPTVGLSTVTAYGVVRNGCSAALPAGAGCTVAVAFKPTVGGGHSASLDVASGTHRAAASLAGRGAGVVEVKRPRNGKVTGGGLDCGDTCTITSSSPVLLSTTAATGYRFERWSPACGSSLLCKVSITAAKQEVEAIFIER